MSFKQIYGHEKKVAILQSAVGSQRISHAYLFYGIEGIGKETTARQFAKALNCLGTGPDACDHCASCLKIDHQNHPDLIGVYPDGQFIRIKEIREIQNQMRFSPLEGRFRVFIISQADRMNSAAANALLKTLEEPSPRNVLILISSQSHRLPATILSRCQRLRFDPLPTAVVASFLEHERQVEAVQAFLLAASAAGSIGKSLEMNQGGYVSLKNGIIDRFCDLKDPLDFFSFLSDFGPDREEITQRLDILLTWHRDILLCREGGDPQKLIHRDRADRIQELSQKAIGPDILEKIKTITRTRRAIEQNAHRQLALECMMFRLFRKNERNAGRKQTAGMTDG